MEQIVPVWKDPTTGSEMAASQVKLAGHIARGQIQTHLDSHINGTALNLSILVNAKVDDLDNNGCLDLMRLATFELATQFLIVTLVKADTFYTQPKG